MHIFINFIIPNKMINSLFKQLLLFFIILKYLLFLLLLVYFYYSAIFIQEKSFDDMSQFSTFFKYANELIFRFREGFTPRKVKRIRQFHTSEKHETHFLNAYYM